MFNVSFRHGGWMGKMQMLLECGEMGYSNYY